MAEEHWEAEELKPKGQGDLSGCRSEFSEGFQKFSLQWMKKPGRLVVVCVGHCNRLVHPSCQSGPGCGRILVVFLLLLLLLFFNGGREAGVDGPTLR